MSDFEILIDSKTGVVTNVPYIPTPLPPPTEANVNAQRDYRVTSPFTFQGKEYDADAISIARISGAAVLALGALVGGAQAGDYRWHGGSSDFVWIAHDNTLTTMDAHMCFALGQAAASHVSKHVFAAKTLRAMDPIPANYFDDVFWP